MYTTGSGGEGGSSGRPTSGAISARGWPQSGWPAGLRKSNARRLWRTLGDLAIAALEQSGAVPAEAVRGAKPDTEVVGLA